MIYNYKEISDKGKIVTYTGKIFDPIKPSPDNIDIIDIAHSLSMLCRFNGHCSHFYSVAQHSVYVSQLADNEDTLIGLLHDASEAYLSDVPRPIKPFLKEYRQMEEKVSKVIFEKFNVPYPINQKIKDIDDKLLRTEIKQLMPFPQKFNDVYKMHIQEWPPLRAKTNFLERFNTLINR